MTRQTGRSPQNLSGARPQFRPNERRCPIMEEFLIPIVLLTGALVVACVLDYVFLES